MKFLVDAMLGKLARFLRIFGNDTVYANDLEDHFKESPVSDENLIIYAGEHDRIIITKDYPLHKKLFDSSIFLEGEGIYNYLHQLKIKLNLDFTFNIEKARCSTCNSRLEKIIDKNLIEKDVKSATLKHYNDFYQCKNPECNKIFWKGSHIDRILSSLDAFKGPK